MSIKKRGNSEYWYDGTPASMNYLTNLFPRLLTMIKKDDPNFKFERHLTLHSIRYEVQNWKNIVSWLLLMIIIIIIKLLIAKLQIELQSTQFICEKMGDVKTKINNGKYKE